MRDHDREHDAYPPRDEWLIAAPRDKPDRWAHRRGEPRGWALLWSTYLLGACVVALFTPAARLSFDPQQIRASCTLLLALILLGVAVFWPLVRFSQIPARVPSRAAAVDLLIVLAPAATILAPMRFLTRWSTDTVLALSVSLGAWALLFGGLVALGARTRSNTWRALAMLACLALVGLGPALGILAAHGAPLEHADEIRRASLLASPVGAPFAIARFPTPRAPNPDVLAWRFAFAPLALATLAWLGAIVVDLARPAPRRSSSYS